MNYLRDAPGSRKTPQSEPILGAGQVPNSAGGYSWGITPLQRLQRFLVLGSEGGTYYIAERELTKENVACLAECDPIEAINLIVDISDSGRAPKNDAALFALAYYAGYGHPRPDAKALAVRKYALDRLPRVARIGTHFFHFLTYAEKFRGWGRGLRRAVADWYEQEDLGRVAYQAVKYRQRDGWSQRDLLRLAHPDAPTRDHAALYDWIARPEKYGASEFPSVPIVEGFLKAQAAKDPEETARLVTQFNLPREALNTDHLTSPRVWEALLYAGKGMPLTALIRNLPTMTRVGLLAPFSDHVAEVTRRLGNDENIHAARVHPLSLLTAQLTYQRGKSVRGDSTWQPVSPIVDVLDAAFYLAFPNVETTGKRMLLAVDVSGSMDGMTYGVNPRWIVDGYACVNGVPGLTPRIAAAAMALVTANVEPNHYIMAFSDELVPVEVSPRQRIDDVARTFSNIRMGGTDCALPMLWAMGYQKHGAPAYGQVAGRYGQVQQWQDSGKTVEVDAFVVYTDAETWAGGVHPAQALTQYRQTTGLPARFVCVGMVSNGFTIADPNDPGMLDVVGFDTAAPQVISDFTAGKL